MIRNASVTLFLIFSSLVMQAQTSSPTGPGIIAIGSPLVWSATNAPDNFTADTTFSSTPVQVDNGAVTIWQKQLPTGSNGEWDIFYMKTTNGGPLAGNVNGNWEIDLDFTFTAPVFFDHDFNQFMVNGAPVNPLTKSVGVICCAVTSTPLSSVLPGPAYYSSITDVAYPAGQFSTNGGGVFQAIYLRPYSDIRSAVTDPNAPNELVFAFHFTLKTVPAITSVISAGQFGAFSTIAPGGWIEIYGNNLSPLTNVWAQSNFNGVFAPTTLETTTATISGQSAYIEYVSPTQIDVQVPGGIPTGMQPLIVHTEAGESTPFTVSVDATQPGLLAPSSFNIGGTQYVVALFSDGMTYALPQGAISAVASRPASPGDTITFYGIGFGQVNEGTAIGQIAQGQASLEAPVAFSFGGTPATVSYAGLAPNFVGLYQFNVVVPDIAAGNAVPVTFTLDGVPGTQKLFLAIQ